MALSFAPEADAILQQFASLQGTEDGDMEVTVGPDKQSFRIHSLIFRVRSPYFRGLLASGMQETRSASVHLDGDPKAFELLLPFIYSGKACFVEDCLEKFALVSYTEADEGLKGSYALTDLQANDHPVFKHELKNWYAYRASDCRWMFVEGQERMAVDAGVIRSAVGAKSPYLATDWQVKDAYAEEGWSQSLPGAWRFIVTKKSWRLTVSLNAVRSMAMLADYLQLEGFSKLLAGREVGEALQHKFESEGQDLASWLETPSLCQVVGNAVKPEWGKNVFHCLCTAKRYGLEQLEAKCLSCSSHPVNKCMTSYGSSYLTESKEAMRTAGEDAVAALNLELSKDNVLRVASAKHFTTSLVLQAFMAMAGYILKLTASNMCLRTTGGKAKVCNEDLQLVQMELSKRMTELSSILDIGESRAAKRQRHFQFS